MSRGIFPGNPGREGEVEEGGGEDAGERRGKMGHRWAGAGPEQDRSRAGAGPEQGRSRAGAGSERAGIRGERVQNPWRAGPETGRVGR